MEVTPPQNLNDLKDPFGRRFSYLRLSITDVCNFRCAYCLPDGYQKCESSFLSLFEIQNLISAFAELGTWKVRITGGEPALRKDLLDIVRVVSQTSGVRKVGLSTNGFRLRALAQDLFDAGVMSLNVSVDSLDPERFHKITGQDRLAEVLEGIETAISIGFPQVKVNAVLFKNEYQKDFALFQEWIRLRPITVRWIELMPTGRTQGFFRENHVSATQISSKLREFGWKPKPRGEADGPALEFEHPDYLGCFGVIAPYSKDFCSSCNRLRVTSNGGLRLCLFGDEDISLRSLVQSGKQKQELKSTLISLLQRKEISHFLKESKTGINQTFSAIGG